jgi:hypothetical protein
MGEYYAVVGTSTFVYLLTHDGLWVLAISFLLRIVPLGEGGVGQEKEPTQTMYAHVNK